MNLDTPQQESTPLNTNEAAAVFAEVLEPPPEKEEEQQTSEEPVVEAQETPEEASEDSDDEDSGVTIEVDGKTVKLSKAELAEAYKNGLRQSDYTKKTMEVAEQRKAAEAAIAQARQERETYATNLQKMAAQIEGALEQQQNIDWQALLESDPVEYLKQQRIFEQRQAALQQNRQQQQILAQQAQAEAMQMHQYRLHQEQQELLAKLPEWTDPGKAKAEKAALATYLKEIGYGDEEVSSVADHRAVIMARKAMLYDKMMGKADAASKKVAAAPARVLKSGSGEAPRMDSRTRAVLALNKSGKVEDAAAAFASLL